MTKNNQGWLPRTKFAWGISGFVLLAFALVFLLTPLANGTTGQPETAAPQVQSIPLPEPRRDSEFSLERAIDTRRSWRLYSNQPLSLAEVGQVLWSAQGITQFEWGFRAAPSAGATYPLNTYLLVGDVVGLSAGLYRYQPEGHRLELVRSGDLRREFAQASLGQQSLTLAGASLVLTGVFSRTTGRYSQRGMRYVHLEAGHAAQNAHLQATALGLGMVPIGAFDDQPISSLLGLSRGEEPLYILPFGRQGDQWEP